MKIERFEDIEAWQEVGKKAKVKRIKDKVPADIRVDRKKLAECVRDVDAVFHTAAQVAVTTSVVDPREDFEINALGHLACWRRSGR